MTAASQAASLARRDIHNVQVLARLLRLADGRSDHYGFPSIRERAHLRLEQLQIDLHGKRLNASALRPEVEKLKLVAVIGARRDQTAIRQRFRIHGVFENQLFFTAENGNRVDAARNVHGAVVVDYSRRATNSAR